jgi:uncharacterized membrane protein YkgB
MSLGIVFTWFGVLKFFPGTSPAESLATDTIAQLTGGAISRSLAIHGLAVWEVLIGLGLLSGRFLRVTLGLLFLQMPGTMLPLIFFPDRTFTTFPLVPTLEGQYIIKNLVLVSAALVVGAGVGRRQGGKEAKRH